MVANALFASLLFTGAAVAHTGIKSILIDGNLYAPFDGRLDYMLMPVNRVGWSYDHSAASAWNPITNYSSPDLACRTNAKPPTLKAKARAGAEVSVYWTPITRMHNGPAIAYLGELPTPDTKPQDIKFFKIYEKGFDANQDAWANQIANDHGDSYTFQLPSDIKPGSYVLRTELIALHGNMKGLKAEALKGQVQIYPHCFNVEISGTGTATPTNLVSFPGAYKADDFGLSFAPYFTYGSEVSKTATEENAKYVPPGPPVYTGKFDAPTGVRPRVTAQEAGIYPAEQNVKYQDFIRKIERPALKLAVYVNTAWPNYKADEKLMDNYGKAGVPWIQESRQVMDALKPEIEAFRIETHK